MSTFHLLFLTLVLGALASGASALEALVSGDVALRWQDLPLIVLGLAVALLQVLALQAGAGRARWVLRGWQACVSAGSVFIAAGISALAVALAASDVAPRSFLFLAIGAGLLVAALMWSAMLTVGRTGR
ncbi:hypothetical protein [Variovorax sp. J31P207]|uniref:hypothetical protein n=1 Tax=Variovorax sp. J31P207 TaxID=3053510 RepID=UPI002577D1D6|nr:hypothetical protein [Variovorax sp. J31P207]MDM0072718.1 hypothetical protein [Variovorax sp. J31P207]